MYANVARFLCRFLSIDPALLHIDAEVDDRNGKTHQNKQKYKRMSDFMCSIRDQSDNQGSQPTAALVRNGIESKELGLSSSGYKTCKQGSAVAEIKTNGWLV